MVIYFIWLIFFANLIDFFERLNTRVFLYYLNCFQAGIQPRIKPYQLKRYKQLKIALKVLQK